MRIRSKWSLGLLASCFVLSLSAAACGDDSDDNNTEPTAGKGGSSAGGAGGSTGGKGGSSAGGKGGSSAGGAGGSTGGKGGSSAGGKGGTGGAGGSGTVTVASCKSKVDGITGDALQSGCSMCLCTEITQAASACDEACWSVIKCANEKCPGQPQSCAMDMCKTEINNSIASGSISSVTTVSGTLQGEKCGPTCIPSDGDAGTP